MMVILGLILTALAVVGALLPLLPSTPFALLAVFFFSKSSPFLHQKMLALPFVGSAVNDWQKYHAISIPSKIMALLFLSISVVNVSLKENLSIPIKVGAGLAMLFIAIFILSRSSMKMDKESQGQRKGNLHDKKLEKDSVAS